MQICCFVEANGMDSLYKFTMHLTILSQRIHTLKCYPLDSDVISHFQEEDSRGEWGRDHVEIMSVVIPVIPFKIELELKKKLLGKGFTYQRQANKSIIQNQWKKNN